MSKGVLQAIMSIKVKA